MELLWCTFTAVNVHYVIHSFLFVIDKYLVSVDYLFHCVQAEVHVAYLFVLFVCHYFLADIYAFKKIRQLLLLRFLKRHW